MKVDILDSMDESNFGVFAEIDMETKPREAGRALPKPIGISAADPVRQRFLAMRALAAGEPYRRDDGVLFYEQAKYMENFTDDYAGYDPFSVYYPRYQRMGHDQLRTYFTWRTKARRGETPPICLSYLFLHTYELLSCIGVSSPEEGLGRLVWLWNNYKGFDAEYKKALDAHFPGWIKDYHIYYDLDFLDFVLELDIKHYPELFIFGDAADSIEMWSAISPYDITGSKFYKAGNEQLLRDCFSAVMDAIRRVCDKHDGSIKDMLTLGAGNRRWYPFAGALFYDWKEQSDRKAALTGGEVYTCKNNQWTLSTPVYDLRQNKFAGYFVKKTEACLRQAVNYKNKLTINLTPHQKARFKLMLGIAFKEFETAIETTVAEFVKAMSRITVTIDTGNLDGIRKDARETQDKLLVPEDVAILDEPKAPAPALTPPAPVTAGGGWDAFKAALSDAERRALCEALGDGARFFAVADKEGIMPEILAESINEKAAEHIGDVVLGEDMAVYDEYRDKVSEITG